MHNASLRDLSARKVELAERASTIGLRAEAGDLSRDVIREARELVVLQVELSALQAEVFAKLERLRAEERRLYWMRFEPQCSTPGCPCHDEPAKAVAS